MERIEVHLIGNPYVLFHGERVTFPYKKAEGFFYYLCVRKNTTREEVIQVLWGDDDETAGRKSLREAIYQIKKLFGKEILVTKGHSEIGFNPEQLPEVDWDHATQENILDYDGCGLMTHFHVKNSYEYGEWMDGLRAEYNRRGILCAQNRLRCADSGNDAKNIQQYGGILLKFDSYNEELYCEVMDIYSRHGYYNMAIRIYNDLQKVLREELDVEPSAQATELFHQIYNMKEIEESNRQSSSKFFYGRTRELYQFNQILMDFTKGNNEKYYLVEGEPGVGKTALLNRIEQNAVGYHLMVFRTDCFQNEEDFFLNSWRDIFHRMLQYADKGLFSVDEIQEQLDLLDSVFDGSYFIRGSQEHNGLTFQMIEQTILAVFDKMARQHRVVLCIDNIQWMDALSVQLLNRILLTCGPDRILLLGAFRVSYEARVMDIMEPLLERESLEIASLECFSPDDAEHLIDAICQGVTLDSTMRGNIYEMTGGNAFFLLELLNLIKEKGYTLEMSRQTVNVMKSRLAMLSEKENQVLDAMSVFPDRVDIDELSWLIQESNLEILTQVEALKQKHLIQEILVEWNVYYDFSHHIIREYTYERQSEGRRRLMHKLVAEQYERQYQAEKKLTQLPIILYHYEKCQDRTKIYEYKIQYFKEFYLIFQENFPLFEMDMERKLLPDSDSIGGEEIMNLAREVIHWEDHSEQALHLKMEMHYLVGRYQIAKGVYGEGCFHVQECIKLAETLDESTALLNAYRQMVFFCTQTGKSEEMKSYLDKSFSLLEGKEMPEAYGVFLRLRGLYQLQIGEYGKARETLQQSVDVFEGLQTVQRRHSMNISASYLYMGDCQLEEGSYEEALKLYVKAIDNNTHRVVTNGLSQAYTSVGQVYYYMKDYNRAEGYLNNAIEFFEAYEYFWGWDKAEIFMTLTKLAMGDKVSAGEHYERGLWVAEKMQNPHMLKMYEEVKPRL